MRRLAALLVLAVAAGASAQPLWQPTSSGPGVSVDVLKPVGVGTLTFTDSVGTPLGESGPGLLHSTQVLSARVPIGDVWTVVADLPMAYFTYDSPDGFDPAFEDQLHDFSLGNPYLGVEAAAWPGLTLGGGVRVPLAHDEYGGGTIAGLSSLVELPETFLDVLSVAASAQYEAPLSRAVRVRVQAAPTLLFASYRYWRCREGACTEVEESDRTVAVHYAVQVLGTVGPVEVGGAVAGRATSDEGTTGYYAPVIVGAEAALWGLPVRPAVQVKVPVAGDHLIKPDAVVGFSLDVPFR